MPTTKTDIKRWFREGVRMGATHMLVVVDDFDHEDYPKFVKADEDVQRIVADYAVGTFAMQRVIEVYRLDLNMDSQLAEHRAFHL